MQRSCAREGERDAPTWEIASEVPEDVTASRALLREKFSSRTENPHGFELPRTLSCKATQRGSVVFLTFDRYAERPDVAAAIERSDRDCVLAGR